MNAITTTHLIKKYKDKTVVNDLNLDIKHGELFALLGTNGAGKTTTIKMLSCLIRPTSGKITILNLDASSHSQWIKSKINLSPQETAVAPNLTVLENFDFFADIYQIKNKKAKIHTLIHDFRLEKFQHQKVKTLSGGWQRRLSIALALINDPKVLFLDEPTLGLDVIARKELWHIIEGLKGKITIILTTHYMEEAEALSDHIGIMAEGHLVAIGTAKTLIRQAKTKNFEDAFIKIATSAKTNIHPEVTK